MSTRTRHEASIKRLDRNTEADFQRAILNIVFSDGADGQFWFFTVDQVAVIRKEMLRQSTEHRAFRRRQRQQISAIRAMCEPAAQPNMIGQADE